MTNNSATTQVPALQGITGKRKAFLGQVKIEWVENSAVPEEYFNSLVDQGYLDILSKDVVRSVLNLSNLELDTSYCWSIQGIDPRTGELGQRQVKTGGDPKYRTPYRGSSDAVVLPLPNGKSFREELERTGRVLLTEGGKKVAMIIGLTGIPSVSLCGVTNWAPETKGGKERPILKGIWQDIKEIGAEVLIAFDMDSHTNEKVKQQLRQLKQYCDEQGIPSRVLEWNKNYKGIDDYIASIDSEENQKKELLEVLNSSFDVSQWEKQFKGSDKGQSDDPESVAEELLDEFRQNYKFHREQKTWRVWNGKFWEKKDNDLITASVRTSVKTKGYKLKKTQNLEDVIRWLKTDLLQPEWITKPRDKYINFSNGVFEIETGNLLPHQPGYHFTACLEREFKEVSPDGGLVELLMKHCPVFCYSYLEQFNQDVSQVLKLVAVINAMLTYRCYGLQFFLQLQGKPGSGKGTFARLLTAIAGKGNTVSLSLADLNSDYHKARAVPAQLIICSDEDKQSGNQYKGFKAITGGDLISYRPIYGEPAEDYFYGLLVVISNNAIFAGDTTGIDRRICLVKFNESFKKLDRSFESAMMQEIDALVSIALMMSEEEVESRIKEASGTSTKLDRWTNKVETCSVAAFMEEVLVPAITECKEPISGKLPEDSGIETLYVQYTEFCSDNGRSRTGENIFSRRLGENLEFLEWSHKKGKARHGKSNAIPTIWGIASRINKSGFEGEPTISERLGAYTYRPEESLVAGTSPSVADDFGLVAGNVADISENPETLLVKEQSDFVADVADDFAQTPTSFIEGGEENATEVSKKSLPPQEIPATSATALLDKASEPATASATKKSVAATSATDDLTGWNELHVTEPYPRGGDKSSRQKRALAIRQAYSQASTLEDLKPIRAKFEDEEIHWVNKWLKAIFPDEYDRMIGTSKITQPTIPGMDS